MYLNGSIGVVGKRWVRVRGYVGGTSFEDLMLRVWVEPPLLAPWVGPTITVQCVPLQSGP